MIEIPAGDYGYVLTLTAEDANETAYNLTDYTVTLKVWRRGGDLEASGVCTVTDAVNGVCQYTIAEGDFDNPGRYKAELELTKDGVVESSEHFTIAVTESK